MTLCQILTTPAYHPPPCKLNVCVMTGLGGIVEEWTTHVDRHPSALFIVSGVCASACMIAVERAAQRGERVLTMPDARFVPHEPTMLDH